MSHPENFVRWIDDTCPNPPFIPEYVEGGRTHFELYVRCDVPRFSDNPESGQERGCKYALDENASPDVQIIPNVWKDGTSIAYTEKRRAGGNKKQK